MNANPFADISGRRFGSLVAQWPIGRTRSAGTVWLCSCDCGKLRLNRLSVLSRGRVRSCGCMKGRLIRNRKIADSPHRGRYGTIEHSLWKWAKARAIEKNLSFNISVDDVVIPENCPLLGIPIFRGTLYSHRNSASLDRIIPSRGYVRGNIRVISHRANNLKGDACLEELELLVANWRSMP